MQRLRRGHATEAHQVVQLAPEAIVRDVGAGGVRPGTHHDAVLNCRAQPLDHPLKDGDAVALHHVGDLRDLSVQGGEGQGRDQCGDQRGVAVE